MTQYILWRYPLDKREQPYHLPNDSFDRFEHACGAAAAYAMTMGFYEYDQEVRGLFVTPDRGRILARIEIVGREPVESEGF